MLKTGQRRRKSGHRSAGALVGKSIAQRGAGACAKFVAEVAMTIKPGYFGGPSSEGGRGESCSCNGGPTQQKEPQPTTDLQNKPPDAAHFEEGFIMARHR